jgi:SOS response regulatory protein OraA/RecX
MLDYIFRSRTEENDFLEEAIKGKKVLTAYERALEEGELKKAIETARKMLEKGFSSLEIQDISGLSEDELRENGVL